MRKMILGVLAVAVMAGGVAGQTGWYKTCGGSNIDIGFGVTVTKDRNFIVVGATMPYGRGEYDVYILKIKPNGDTVWTKTYGGVNSEIAYSVLPMQDGNLMVVGYTHSFSDGQNDAYLLKINPDGDTIWTKTYGGKASAGASSIIPTSDGNYIVAGETNPVTAPNTAVNGDVYFIKITPDGDTVWTKSYGGDNYDNVASIIATSDGNFIAAGHTQSTSNGVSDVYILKINPNGDTLWTKKYGTDNEEGAYAIIEAKDGNFLIAGYFRDLDGNGQYGPLLLKINTDGDTLWTKSYDYNYGYFMAISATSDGYYIAVGMGIGGPVIVKINSNGGIVWAKSIGVPRFYSATSIAATASEDFIVVGSGTSVFDSQQVDVSLISIIDDRYAKKDSLFTFKISVSGDTLNHGYVPLKVPAGMTVSTGGTISWTPTTDSSYMDHVEFLVSDDFGKKDTLTFNIFVNNRQTSKATNPLSLQRRSPLPNEITVRHISSQEVRFSLPAGTKSLSIYNIHGQLLENLSVKENQAAWLPKHAAGRYFAKAIWEKREAVKPFILMR
jgi:hypothetical protein